MMHRKWMDSELAPVSQAVSPRSKSGRGGSVSISRSADVGNAKLAKSQFLPEHIRCMTDAYVTRSEDAHRTVD